MPDITIPDAALEAVYHKWRSIDSIIGTGDIRLIIAAAAPHIAAQALRDAVSDMVWDLPRYRDARVMIVQRADRIEADHG